MANKNLFQTARGKMLPKADALSEAGGRAYSFDAKYALAQYACGGGATETMKQWNAFKQRSPHDKMVCIDIQPYGTAQAKERSDIINVGGFNDQVFSLIADVVNGDFSTNHWVNTIETIKL